MSGGYVVSRRAHWVTEASPPLAEADELVVRGAVRYADGKSFAGGLKAIVNLSKSGRAKYRQVMDDTCSLIDTTLNMAILRPETSCLKWRLHATNSVADDSLVALGAVGRLTPGFAGKGWADQVRC